jgi:hypothetical protein
MDRAYDTVLIINNAYNSGILVVPYTIDDSTSTFEILEGRNIIELKVWVAALVSNPNFQRTAFFRLKANDPTWHPDWEFTYAFSDDENLYMPHMSNPIPPDLTDVLFLDRLWHARNMTAIKLEIEEREVFGFTITVEDWAEICKPLAIEEPQQRLQMLLDYEQWLASPPPGPTPEPTPTTTTTTRRK